MSQACRCVLKCTGSILLFAYYRLLTAVQESKGETKALSHTLKGQIIITLAVIMQL